MNRREFVVLAAAAPLGLRAAFAGAAVARPPLALVTCDEESRLAVVDLASFRVVGSIATPAAPRSIQLVGDRAVVAHWTLGLLAIVDRRRVLHIVEGLDEPRYAAAHPDGVHVLVTDSSYGLVVLDARRARIVGRVRLPEWPRHVSVDPAGRTAWVGLGSASTHVAVVDVSDMRRPRRTALVAPPFRAHDVGVASDGGHVWVTSGATARTAVYGSAHGLRETLAADAAPQHVAFGHGVAYVTSGDSGTFRVHSLADGRMLRKSRIPIGSYNVHYARGRVITPSLSAGTLAILDAGGLPLATVQVASACHDACFAPS